MPAVGCTARGNGFGSRRPAEAHEAMTEQASNSVSTLRVRGAGMVPPQNFRRESKSSVTGPSLTMRTVIVARNTPSATVTPRSRTSAQNRS